MEFFQSKEIKIFLTAFVAMVALTIGAMKMASSQQKVAVSQTEQTLDGTTITETPTGNEQQGELTGENTQPEENAPVVDSDVYKNGEKAQKEGDLRSALKYYTVASNNADPKVKSAALGALADIYMQYNDSKMVIETLEKQLEIEEDKDIRKKAYVNLAETYKYLDTYDKAIEMYKESYKTEKTPNDVIKLCELYEKLHDDDGIKNQILDYLKDYPYQVSLFNKYKSYLDQPASSTEENKSTEPEVQEYNPPGMEENATEESSTNDENSQK